MPKVGSSLASIWVVTLLPGAPRRAWKRVPRVLSINALRGLLGIWVVNHYKMQLNDAFIEF